MSNAGGVNVQEPGGGAWSERAEVWGAGALSSEEPSSSLITTDSSAGGMSSPDAERESLGMTGLMSAAAEVAGTGRGST